MQPLSFFKLLRVHIFSRFVRFSRVLGAVYITVIFCNYEYSSLKNYGNRHGSFRVQRVSKRAIAFVPLMAAEVHVCRRPH